MKRATFTLLFLAIIGHFTFSQDLNQVVPDTSKNDEILFGLCDREAFEHELFNEWFTDEFESYKVDAESLASIDFENNPQPEITIVMGTWCSDSRREVPRFYKILDLLEYDEDNLTLISVDRQKTAGEVETAHMDIELVPTIILYENGVEKGRIIETPVHSLEKDLAEILTKE